MDIKSLYQLDALVIACMDGRFIKQLMFYSFEKIGDVFDFHTVVGCTKSIVSSPEDREHIFGVIATSLRLRSIKEVHLFDHYDCDAYGETKGCSDADEEAMHKGQLFKAAAIIEKKFSELKVITHYISPEGINIVES